ncbi:MAG: hypothetical protein CMN30_08600 [Sandaracinus sp.]|nr:hypothetical protein [Sandaracinus sp.]|tara:strand:- start:1637 stop:2647 length:1011 start_codon:yes stop_codon:yes gene_type:complete
MRRALPVALLGLVAACDGCGEPREAEPTTPAEVEAEVAERDDAPPDEAPPEVPPEERPLATVVSGWDIGRPVEAETLEVFEESEAVVLDLRDGARITLDPGTVAAVGEEAPAQVILAHGALHAQLPPMGGSSRPSLRIGTPMGTLVLEASGEVYVVAAPDGRVVFFQLAGLGRVHDGETVEEQRPRVITLRPGSSLAGGATDPVEGVGNLEAARGLRADLESAGAEQAAAAELARRERALRATIDTARRERERGVELQRRQLRAAGAPDRQAAIQRELVAHSQVISRQRQVLRTRYERLRAVALLLDVDPDPALATRDDVRVLLGLQLPPAPDPQN